MSTESETPVLSRAQRIVRWLKIGSAAAIVLFAGLWFLSPAGTADAPVRLERDAEGALQEVSEPQKSAFRFGAQATSLKANNMFSTGSTSSHSNPAWFRCESVLVMNLSDHLLMKRVGEALVDELKQDLHLNRIDYLPFGHVPEHGRLAPDFIVTLTLDSIDESGLIGRDLKAHVSVGIGANYAGSSRRTSDHLSPPIVHFSGTSRLQHESTLSGVESAGARYTTQGKNMAVQIGNGISGQLKQLREKSDPRPLLPDVLYPAFREPPEFDFLSQTGATRLTSFHELMAHNETFWQLDESADGQTTVELIQSELEAAGWTVNDHDVDAENGYLRMRDGARYLEVFPKRSGGIPGPDDPPSPLAVRFRDRMTSEELEDVYQKLLDEESTDVELLLGLRRYGTGTQRDEVLKRVETSPPRSVSAWMALADWYAGRKNKDSLFGALQRAHALSFTLGNLDGQDPSSRIKELVKKHELDHDQIRQIDSAIFEELGFVQLGPDQLEGQSQIRGNTPAAFFVTPADSDKWKVLAVHVEQLRGSRVRLMSVGASQNGGRTTSTMEVEFDGSYEYGHGFNGYTSLIRLEANDTGGIDVSVTLQPHGDAE